jgi:tRNA(Ile)-lysidine synthase
VHHRLQQQVERVIQAEQLLEPNQRVIVAVSGGSDSVVLLHLLWILGSKHGWRLAVGHVNHGLRGQESDDEEQFVQRWCAKLDLPCFTRKLTMNNEDGRDMHNLQSRARTLRYAALKEMAQSFGSDTIALAHHGDDQAETVFMRLFQGTGLSGLASMRVKSLQYGMLLIRPLLHHPKSDIINYATSTQLTFIQDSSNASRKYDRNKIRLDLLPAITQLYPNAPQSLCRLAQLSADESDYLEASAQSLANEIIGVYKDRIVVVRDSFIVVHIALQRRLIKIILNSPLLDGIEIDFRKVELVREAITKDHPTTLEIRLSEHIVFRRTYDKLEWIRNIGNQQPIIAYEMQIDVAFPGVFPISGTPMFLEWEWSDRPHGSLVHTDDHYMALFDADGIDDQLVVRTRRAGDRIEPHGGGGTRKVKELFINVKLPRQCRQTWPIVAEKSGKILWIPGVRRSCHATLHGDSNKVLIMRLKGIECSNNEDRH